MKLQNAFKKTPLYRLSISITIFSFQIFTTISIDAATIRNLSIENGLSNRRVLSSANDKAGYIWFATKTNIDRYDGEKFDSYTLSINEKNRGITSDNQKNIYAYTERTVYKYDENTDNFVATMKLDSRKDRLNESAITSVCFDSRNTPFVNTNLGVLYKQEQQWVQINELKNISVQCMINTSDSVYLFATGTGIIELKRTAKGEFKHADSARFDELKRIRIQSIYYDQNTAMLWIGTFANGLYSMPLKGKQKNRLIYKSSLPIKVIRCISEKEIWAGCDGEGIFIFDRYSTNYLRKLTQEENQEENLGANGIYHILEANNKVWVSTYTAGVYIINTRSIVERKFRHQKYDANSLIDDHVNVVYEDSDGDLWFGTNKGLSNYNSKTRRWQHYLIEKNGIENENSVILSIKEDRNHAIWVGGYATSLSKINKQTGQITTINNMPTNSSTGKSYIYAIAEDDEGNMWLGGTVDKLKRYSLQTNSFREFNIEGVHKILNFDSTFIYLATFKGIYKLNKKTGQVISLDLNDIKGGEKLVSYPFCNNVVKDISNQNVLWIATESFGLLRYDQKKQEIAVYDTKAGLSSNYVYGLLYDKQNRLWITTENGLDCYNPTSKSIVSYYEFDGLSNNTFNFLAYTRLGNGKLLLGTPKGANEVNPDQIMSQQSSSFNLRFQNFYLFYNKMKANASNSPLTESVDKTKKITLNYTQHTFSIDFINLDMSNQGRTTYSWKLEGFDQNWSQPSSEHKAVYTNLPAGTYTFQVKAIRMDTNQESEIRTIQIEKLPPFWASIYAYILYFAFIVWLAYFMFKFWLNKVDAQFTQKKMNLFVSMAHEIRTPITLIKAPLNEIDNENLTSEGRSALTLARKNTDKLFGLVTQLLDFQKIESDAMSLYVEETLLNVYVENILNNFQYLAKSKEIDLKRINEVSPEIKVWIDRNKVQIMFENLLTNAIKYTQKGGYINVKTTVEDDKLFILISDNGVGIPAKAQDRLFESFYRAANVSNSLEIGTGIGLMFTKKLVSLHKGKISFVSSENVGSTFLIELPIRAQAYNQEEIAPVHEEILVHEGQEDEQHHLMQILLVEDNDELRAYLGRLLRKKYHVLESANGIEALNMLEKENPDLILTDIMMPEMDGFQLCEKVKSDISTCHIPLILLSALSEKENVIKGLSLGADDYITKPFDIAILESKIKTIFNNRALFRKKYVEKSVSLNESNLLNDLNKNFMKKLVELIEKNITNEEFNIDELSYEMAMSRSVFFKKVKSLTGQNPKDFIRDIKMTKAADLLREQKYSVSEIAYLIGLPNAKYFSTAFKKYYGISPTSFIEKEKREEQYLEQSDAK